MTRSSIRFSILIGFLISVKVISQPLPLNLYWGGKTDSALVVANTIITKQKAFSASYLANAYDFLAEHHLEQGNFEKNKKFIQSLFHLVHRTSIDSALYFARFANYYHCHMMWDSVVYFCNKAINSYSHHPYKSQEKIVRARYYSYIGNATRCTMYRNSNYLDSAILIGDDHPFLKALHYRRYGTFNSDDLNIPEHQWKLKKNELLYKNTIVLLKKAEALATRIYPLKKSSLHGAIYKIWSLVAIARGHVDECLQLANKTKDALVDHSTVLNAADYAGISTFEATTFMNLYYKTHNIAFLYKNEKALLRIIPIWEIFYRQERESQLNGYDDEYNLNPFQKLVAVYFELYKKTNNSLYLSKVFSLVEFLKSKRVAFDFGRLSTNHSKSLDSLERLCKEKHCAVINYFMTHSPKIALAIVSLPDTTFMLNCLSQSDYLLPDHLNDVYRKDVVGDDDVGFPKLNYVMYRSFFSKIDTLLQKRKIGKAVIITDGYLNNLNFDVLQTDTSKFPSMAPSALLQKYKFSYAISASSLLSNRQDAIHYKDLTILAPVYTSTFYPRLIFSEKLVNQLNGLYCTKNLNNISKTYIFKENQLLQFIGHVNSSYMQNEQFLILDDSNAISSVNFENTSINGSSYLLNGCQSGVGRNIKYDRVNNFTHVLLRNNAHAVISTVWPIDDRENAKFQEKFYSFLAQGLSSSDALHQTKLYFAQENYPVTLWGAYVYYGHDFSLSSKKPGYKPLYLILLGLSIATAIFFLLRTRIKNRKPQ